MNGYLQCLIDQYEVKVAKALGGADRAIYGEILNDLKKFQAYIQESQKPIDVNIPKKHIAFDFVGTMPGLMEYLKNLNSKGGK